MPRRLVQKNLFTFDHQRNSTKTVGLGFVVHQIGIGREVKVDFG